MLPALGSTAATVRERVLIVEDDVDISHLERDALETAGYEVEVADTVESATRLIREAEPDVVVLDFSLPEMTGLDLYLLLRRAGVRVPMILVTAITNQETVIEALRAGVRDYIVKSRGFLSYLPVAVHRVLAQVRLETQLAESEARLFAVVESSMDAIVTLGADLTIRYLNPSAEELLGCREAQASGQRIERFLPGAFASSPRGRSASREIVRRIELRLVRPDGRQVPVEAAFSAAEAAGESFITVFLRDISERERAERALRESEERHRAIVETTNEWVWETDLQGRLIYSNSAIREILGYEPLDVLGRDVLSLVHPLDVELAASVRAKSTESRTPWMGVTLRFAHREKGFRHLESNAVPVVSDVGRLLGFRGSDRDVTERHLSQERLLSYQRFLRQIIDADPSLVWVKDHEGRYILANEAYARLLGTTVDRLAWSTDAELLKDEERLGRSAREDLQVLESGQPIAIPEEAVADAATGETRTFQKVKVRLTAPDGRHHVLCVATDITERQKLEAQLRQSQKLEAVGTLAGGIAHDFNNLLTVIQGYTQLLIAEVGEESPLYAELDEIQKAGDRAAALTHQLLAFSRRQVFASEVLDLAEVVTDIERMLRRLIGEHIELVAARDDDAWLVRADRGQIEQVVVNLAINARDAMPQGGTLTIETRNVELDQAYVARHPWARVGPHVLLAVSDTGTGMDAATQARVFEPFFTTKEPGKGTGLGLATVYGIVKQSGGSIEVYSEPGHGTVFKIYLPTVEGTPLPRTEKGSEVLRGTETILVVEDEEAVRILATRALEGYGYDVLTARDGLEACAIAESHAGPIHVLVTDTVMPGMRGPDVAAKVATGRPGTRVLFMSGYTDMGGIRLGIPSTGAAFLQKPFTPEGLARKVREVLGSAPDPGPRSNP